MLTAEDLELRKGKISSSTVAAIMGVDPYCSPMRAWARITGRDDEQVDEATQRRFNRGHILEPALIEYARQRVGDMLGASVSTAHSPTISRCEWAADSIDAVLHVRSADIDEHLGVEAKSVAGPPAALWGLDMTHDVPEYVAQQCYWHMWHHELDTVVVPVLLADGLDLRALFVRRDDGKLNDLIGRAYDWWERHVRGDVAPAPMDGDDVSILERLYRTAPAGQTLADPSGELAQAARRLALARRDRKLAEIEEEAAKLEIANAMREHDSMIGPYGIVTWKREKSRMVTDYEALAQEFLAQCSTEDARSAIERHTVEVSGKRPMRVRLNDS